MYTIISGEGENLVVSYVGFKSNPYFCFVELEFLTRWDK
jgi:hypothetical protein